LWILSKNYPSQTPLVMMNFLEFSKDLK